MQFLFYANSLYDESTEANITEYETQLNEMHEKEITLDVLRPIQEREEVE